MNRSGLLVWVLLLSACATLPPKGTVGMRDVGFPLRDMRLASGLRVVIEEDRRTPMVGVILMIGAGSSSDPVGKEGLAHVVEHLAFRARHDGKLSVWRKLEEMGTSETNATTGLDHTAYFAQVPKEALPHLLRLEGQRLSHPLKDVDAKTFALEREVVRNELRLRGETDYSGQVFNWVQAALFPDDHPYARPLAGTHESLDALTLADAREFVRQQYRPENSTLVVIGDVDLQTIHEVLEAELPRELFRATRPVHPVARMAAEAPEPQVSAKGPMKRGQALVLTPELWLAWSLPRGFDDESYLQDFVLGSVQATISRAFMWDGDLKDMGAFIVPGTQASMLIVRAVLHQGKNPEKSAEHILDQLYRVWAPSGVEGLQQHESIIARQRLRSVTGMVLSAESLLSRGLVRATTTHFTGDPTAYNRSLRSMSNVSSSQVTDFAYKYLTRERARIVLVERLPPEAEPPAVATGIGAEPLDPDSLPVVPTSGALRAAAVRPDLSRFRFERLENGMELLLAATPGLPVAAVGLSLHGGRASDEPAGTSRLASIAGIPGSRIRGEPHEIGAVAFSQTTRDDLQYWTAAGAGNLPHALAQLADRLPTMKVDELALRYVKNELLPYWKTTEALPEEQADRAFWSALYEEHPYGRTVTAEELGRIEGGQIQAWLRRTHVPQNAVLAIAGEVELEEARELATEWLGGWKDDSAALPPPPFPSPTPGMEVRVTARPAASQGQIRLGCMLPRPDEAGLVRNAAMAALVTERLTEALRSRLGATYGIHARAGALRGGAAHLIVEGAVDNEHLAGGLATLMGALEALSRGELAEGELPRAQWGLIRNNNGRLQTSFGVVNALLQLRTLDLPLEALERFPDQVAALSSDQVAEGFAQCLGGRVVLSVIGDEAVVNRAVEGLRR